MLIGTTSQHPSFRDVDQHQHRSFHDRKQHSLLHRNELLDKSSLRLDLFDFFLLGVLIEIDHLWTLCQDQNLVKANQRSHSLWWDHLLLHKCHLPHSIVHLVFHWHPLKCGLWNCFWTGHQQWSILQFLFLGWHCQHCLWWAWRLWNQYLQVTNIFSIAVLFKNYKIL